VNCGTNLQARKVKKTKGVTTHKVNQADIVLNTTKEHKPIPFCTFGEALKRASNSHELISGKQPRHVRSERNCQHFDE
jgi:hypothetical protein